MSSKPVVVYGASGYTGRLVAEFLREYQIPFVAAGRNREKIEAAMAVVPGIETADYEIVTVDHDVDALAHPWGGGTLPLYFEEDPRVRNVRQLTATADRELMEGVLAMQTVYEEEIKQLPDDEQTERLKAFGESQQPGMPPRENRFIHRCIDVVHGSGAFSEVKCTMRTAGGYLTTGALQAATAYFLLNGGQKASGFTSACGAVGYRELYSQLKNLGLVDMQLS